MIIGYDETDWLGFWHQYILFRYGHRFVYTIIKESNFDCIKKLSLVIILDTCDRFLIPAFQVSWINSTQDWALNQS